MAQHVMAQVLGGEKKVVEGVDTIAEVRTQLGLSASYAASINGEPAGNDSELADGDFVSFTEAVKGA